MILDGPELGLIQCQGFLERGVKVKVRERSMLYLVGFEERGHKPRDKGSF